MERKKEKKSPSGGRTSRDNVKDHFQLLDEATGRFNEKLEKIEKSIARQGSYSDALMTEVVQSINEVQQACEAFEERVNFDQVTIKKAQVNFREKTRAFFDKCYFNRARTWPEGYQGDFRTLEDMYNNTAAESGIGLYLDRYLLSSPLSLAVIDREKALRTLINDELRERQQGANVLNIACGSCREVFELAPVILKTGAHVTCIDYDNDALDFSAERLSCSGLLPHHVKFFQYNALKMINEERNRNVFGMQDIVYSAGLFDYVQDEFLIRLLSALYALLNPQGKLIFSFKDSRRYSTFIYHWLIAWDGFLQRTQDDMWSLFEKAHINRSALTTFTGKTGVIIYFTVTK